MVSGGGSSGSCHGPFHHHGFEGVEQIVVEGVVSWVTSKISFGNSRLPAPGYY